MKIGIVIPDRGDRPKFKKHCQHMILNMDLDGFMEVYFVDYKSVNDECDITPRYKKGYEYFTQRGFELIFFMENDDWYAPNYLTEMIKAWRQHGEPPLFGTGYTYYYHIGLARYKQLIHPRRASAMNTLIKPGLEIVYPKDNDPYLDAHLWQQFEKTGVTFQPKKIISIGMKHNVGKTGGAYHDSKLERYRTPDTNLEFLKNTVDLDSFLFYQSMHKEIKQDFEKHIAQ